MNIKGQGHLLTSVQNHSDSTFSNFFSLETARPIKAKILVEPPWERETLFKHLLRNHWANQSQISYEASME